MNSDRLMKATLALGGALALGACASTYSASAGPIDSADFGEANRQTYAAMIVNPDPQYTEPMRTSAEQAADAAERYRDGEVKQPERISSTESASE
jgi:ABC-type sugar transport system substrate-binding protein